MSKVKIATYIIICGILLAFFIFAYYYIANTTDITADERTNLSNNFSPLRLVLFAIMGYSISQVLDKLLKNKVWRNNELLSRVVRFILIMIAIIIGLILMLTSSLLFYIVPLLALAVFMGYRLNIIR